MIFGISANPTIRGSIDIAKKTVSILEAHGEEVWVEEDMAEVMNCNGRCLSDMEGSIDILVTIGGDGTVLRALQKVNAPVFAIHMGRLGFLNEIEIENLERSLIKVMEGKYNLEKHYRIRAFVDGEATCPALNEIVMHTSQIVKMREFQVFIDGQEIDRFRADAVIVATPTGSTGYAFSAGGPLIDPRVEAMVLLPLAPFQVKEAAKIIPLSALVKIRLAGKKNSLLVIDGQTQIELEGDEVVEISRASSPVQFIRLSNIPFFERQKKFHIFHEKIGDEGPDHWVNDSPRS